MPLKHGHAHGRISHGLRYLLNFHNKIERGLESNIWFVWGGGGQAELPIISLNTYSEIWHSYPRWCWRASNEPVHNWFRQWLETRSVTGCCQNQCQHKANGVPWEHHRGEAWFTYWETYQMLYTKHSRGTGTSVLAFMGEPKALCCIYLKGLYNIEFRANSTDSLVGKAVIKWCVVAHQGFLSMFEEMERKLK